jgi:hypothetical protein
VEFFVILIISIISIFPPLPHVLGETSLAIEVSEIVVSGSHVILGTMAGGVTLFNVENGELEAINHKEYALVDAIVVFSLFRFRFVVSFFFSFFFR